jgi:hypothetical protein
MPTLTGPRPPLLVLVRDVTTYRAAAAVPASSLLRDAARHAISDQTIVRLDDQPHTWTVIGPSEQHRHLLGLGPDYLAVTARMRAIDIVNAVAAKAAHLDDRPNVAEALLGGRAEQARDAAEHAAPMIAVALSYTAWAGLLSWDTEETVMRAAWRTAVDAAWDLHSTAGGGRLTAAAVFARALDLIGIADRPAVDYAKAWLDEYPAIDAFLTARGIIWGGRVLDAGAVAERVGVGSSTWRAYVARGESPKPDCGGGWRYSTVDAWRLTRRVPPADWA